MRFSCDIQGPFEVGNAILGRPGILEMIIAMVDSGNVIHVVSWVSSKTFPTSFFKNSNKSFSAKSPSVIHQKVEKYVLLSALGKWFQILPPGVSPTLSFLIKGGGHLCYQCLVRKTSFKLTPYMYIMFCHAFILEMIYLIFIYVHLEMLLEYISSRYFFSVEICGRSPRALSI